MLNLNALGIHHISVCVEALLTNISNADFINYILYRISNYRTEQNQNQEMWTRLTVPPLKRAKRKRQSP